MGETRILSFRVTQFQSHYLFVVVVVYKKTITYSHLFSYMNENSESNCKYTSHVVCTFGVAPGLANAQPPGSIKFANTPLPELTRWANAPQWPWN